MQNSGSNKSLFVVAGPNGAGKTSYAFANIAQVAGSTEFINLDEIARGLSPLDPDNARQRAARVALDMMRDLIAMGKTFTIETTLSGKTHLRMLSAARKAGFEIVLLYFAPINVEVCLTRIARRVSEGGHNVPEADVRRRFQRSLYNLPDYATLCDTWRVFDVTARKVQVAAEGKAGCVAALSPQSAIPAQIADWVASLPECEEGR